MVTEAVNTARAAGVSAGILVRGDSAYGNSAVVDPDTGALISDAEVAEVGFTAFASTDRPV
ncbi:MAG: IS1380 family transposase, partial [Sciscionella sp.]